MKRIVLMVILSLMLTKVSLLADYRDLNEKGVKAYKRQAYDSSLQYFQEAIEINPESKVLDFNLGNVFHQEGMYQDALLNYEMAASSDDSVLNAESFYNMGNTHYRAGELDKAVEAYKKALDFDPGDEDAKYNLELALKRMEEQQKQQNEECQDDNKDQKEDEQDKKDQEKKQDQQNQKQEEKEQEKQQQEKENQKEKQDQDKQQEQNKDKQQEEEKQEQNTQEQEKQQDSDTSSASQQQPSEEQPPQLDEQRAQALLEGLNEDEKEVLKNLIKQRIPVSSYKGKEW